MDTKKIPKLNREKKPKAPKRKHRFHINWLLIFAIICVAVPAGALGWVLLQAQIETTTPQLGARFEGAFSYEISKDDVKNLEQNLNSLSGVEGVKVTLNVATMRVYIDADNSLDKKRISDLTEEAYGKIDAALPIEKYFTNGLSTIQYDLEIYVYNDMSMEEGFIYFRLVKNAAAETYVLQNVSEALDPELAERLRNNELAESDSVVGTEDSSDVIDDEVGDDD